MGQNGDATVFNTERDPIRFNRQPFLLLKLTPTSFFEGDQNLRYGIEIAPPFGKFSFAFDYGKGKGLGIGRKESKFGSYDRTTTQYRGEIRMYFSDWYPFYALDKKPFGRYYAIEYVHKTVGSSSPVSTAYNTYPYVLLPVPTPSTVDLDDFTINTLERAVNFKIGKHFHITKFLFVDAFAGVGLGYSQSSISNYELQEDVELFEKRKFSFSFPNRTPREESLFLSRTAGLRIALVL